jgi:hypothetical protein
MEGRAMSGAGRSNGGDAVSVLASLVLVISAIWLPWATYRTSALTVTFGSGRLEPVLVLCGTASIVLVVLSRIWKLTVLRWVQLGLGGSALLCSVTVSLSRTASANRMMTIHTGWETTSYAIGAGLAIAASTGLVMASVAQLRPVGRPKYPSSDTSPEVATVC